MRIWACILFFAAALGCSHRVLPAAAPDAPAAEPAVVAPADTVMVPDTSARMKEVYAALDAKLDEYVASMNFIPVEDKYQECDFLIGSVSDSLIRNHIAAHLFEKFQSSNVMGDEAVAIYLVDNWFVPGRVAFKDYSSLAAARVFADFNRQSLIGMKAPSLEAFTPAGGPAVQALADGRLKVLFIYDTSCATCKFESALLEEYFSEYKGVAFDFIAFYAGSDAAAWQQWRSTHFAGLYKEDSPITIKDFWDPEVESDFQRKYGVLSTPRMFLIDEDGTIIGRRLDPPALRQLLEIINAGAE